MGFFTLNLIVLLALITSYLHVSDVSTGMTKGTKQTRIIANKTLKKN